MKNPAKKNHTSFKLGRVNTKFVDETGNRYGKFVVVARKENTPTGDAMWECLCDCGRKVVRKLTALRYAASLGQRSSCGCSLVIRKTNRTLKEHKRAYRRARKYGLVEDEFDAYWQAQRGLCAICLRRMIYPQDSTKRSIDSCCIDHNHQTNMVRGLLCNGCNKGIGLLKDSPEIVSRALTYLLA